MQVRIEGQDIRLLTPKNIDWTKRFRSIAASLKELRVGSALLDGEIVVEDGNGVSSFNDLQSDLKAGRQDRFRYHVFDLLHCDGFDLTQATLIDRKALLQRLLGALPASSPIRFSEHLEQTDPQCSSMHPSLDWRASSQSAGICHTGQDGASTG